MKSLHKILIPLFCFLLLFNCEGENDSGFSIEISDGTMINEENISFYDSSTCILFLNKKLKINYVIGEPPNVEFSKFSVFVNNDIIYQGIIYPALVAAISPVPFYISSITYPTFESDIISLNYIDHYTNSLDVRNDQRIINSFERSNLLRHGISCTIDSVYVHSYINSSVTCTFTIRNNDNVNYYIPDPSKMGAANFNNYTGGGLWLINKETNEYHWPQTDNITSDWDNLTMDDLSILEGKSEITFTYTSLFYPKIDRGLYKGNLRFSSMYQIRPVTLPLDQFFGRVWVGYIFSKIDNLIFD